VTVAGSEPDSAPGAVAAVASAAAAPKHIVLGVGGGIAAYKVADLLRHLVEAGHHVTVVPTSSALKFVGEATWAALSHHPVATDVWSDAHDVPHVRIGREADLVVVAPATADLLAKAAHGLADDLLTNALLTARCPVLFVPAMHTEMWEHPATRDNVATLRRRSTTVLEPAIGRLTGVDTGKGRLPEPAEIARIAELLLHRGISLPADLVGRHVVITAGGTREALDPVRFLGNLPAPAGSEVIRVVSAEQLREATHAAAKNADVVVMAAAVADFRPAVLAPHKIKKTDAEPAPVTLVRNPDVLAELVAARSSGELDAVLVGFAAETGDDSAGVLEHGRDKLVRKGCDFLVVNAVSDVKAFGQPDNAAVILGADGSEREVPLGPKTVLASAILDSVISRLDR
jgi:phosphopantothenoylcysteine decarboxylase/phosphopantothenate--cysteine ligase